MGVAVGGMIRAIKTWPNPVPARIARLSPDPSLIQTLEPGT